MELSSIVEDAERRLSSPGFGTVLRHYRAAAGLSQEALAERAGMSVNGIGSLERGDRRSPRPGTVAILARALGLRGEQLQQFELAGHSEVQDLSELFDVPTQVASDSIRANLPLVLSSFVSRSEDLVNIARLMEQHRLVTLIGCAGIGKTRTALQIGTQLMSASEGSVAFISLEGTSNYPSVIASIRSMLCSKGAVDDELESLVALFKSKQLVVILDNCEHVVADVARIVESVLSGCPEIRILATSREPIKAAGEYAYRLPSLESPPVEATLNLTASKATAYDAIVLFVERAKAVDYEFALNDENAPLIAEICRHLDGIPLAIELAAARVNLFSVHDLAENLKDRLGLLGGGERTASLRHKTMRAAIEWSYDLLSRQEQLLFERLCLFPDSFTFATAIKTLCEGEIAQDEAIDALSSLVDKSMLVADLRGLAPRYRILESFREYGRGKFGQRQ